MAHSSFHPPVPTSREKSAENLIRASPQITVSANTLLLSLTALITDDLTDAIICAKKIAKETEGMNYW